MSNEEKQNILEHIKNQNFDWFDYYSDSFGLKQMKYQEVDSGNDGDGNDRWMTLFFSEHNMYVTLTGGYSSYGESGWSDIYVSEPYIYSETRYQKKKDI